VLRLFLGLVKGAVIGAGIGYGFYHLGWGGGFHWITYGLIGAMVGLLVGRPIWSHLLDKQSTAWTSIIKAIVGFGMGCGIYALVAKVWGAFDVTIAEETRNLVDFQYLFGGMLGGVYGAWIEVDDAVPAKGGASKPAPPAAPAKPAAKPAVRPAPKKKA
jgi:hypothetical protein